METASPAGLRAERTIPFISLMVLRVLLFFAVAEQDLSRALAVPCTADPTSAPTARCSGVDSVTPPPHLLTHAPRTAHSYSTGRLAPPAGGTRAKW